MADIIPIASRFGRVRRVWRLYVRAFGLAPGDLLVQRRDGSWFAAHELEPGEVDVADALRVAGLVRETPPGS